MKLEVLWQSFSKRQRRRFKLEALLRGADPFSGGVQIAGSAGPEASAVTIGRSRDWEEASRRKPPDRLGRQPTDADNWDLGDRDLMNLATSFPGMVVTR
jgi:hypothetical protein